MTKKQIDLDAITERKTKRILWQEIFFEEKDLSVSQLRVISGPSYEHQPYYELVKDLGDIVQGKKLDVNVSEILQENNEFKIKYKQLPNFGKLDYLYNVTILKSLSSQVMQTSFSKYKYDLCIATRVDYTSSIDDTESSSWSDETFRICGRLNFGLTIANFYRLDCDLKNGLK